MWETERPAPHLQIHGWSVQQRFVDHFVVEGLWVHEHAGCLCRKAHADSWQALEGMSNRVAHVAQQQQQLGALLETNPALKQNRGGQVASVKDRWREIFSPSPTSLLYHTQPLHVVYSIKILYIDSPQPLSAPPQKPHVIVLEMKQ